MQGKKSKMTMRAPDLSVSKANQERALKLYGHFLTSIRTQLTHCANDFSTLTTISRFLSKSTKPDPAEAHIMDVVRRMQKDKLHAEIALQLSETSALTLQSMQKTVIIQMIPYLLGLFLTIIFVVMALFVKPLEFSNPALQRYLLLMIPAVALLVWGLVTRSKMKFDMLSLNILMQASSAFASAKMQGKGEIGALQNLAEMKRRAASMEKNSKKKKEQKS